MKKIIAGIILGFVSVITSAKEVPVIGESSPIELIGLQSAISFSVNEPVTLPPGNYHLKVKALNGF